MDDVSSGPRYLDRLDQLLGKPSPTGPLAVDLFAGCGGLSLGFEAQGFQTIGYEIDADCCITYSSGLAGNAHQVRLSPESSLPPAPVLIGGPPCQPFSVGGDQKGRQDSRDGLPTFVTAVRKLRPLIFLFENVRGVLYRNKSYFSQFIDELRELGYAVDVRLMNAVNYGVPQNRERVIAVGHSGGFRFPAPEKFRVTAGEALGSLASSTPEGSRFLTASMDEYVARYERASNCINPRDLELRKPARTLTCRNLAGATGDMQRIRLPDGRRRRLVLREAARLQSFPDWFTFAGGETSQFNQVGNAVPPLFAYALAGSVRAYLNLPPPFAESNATTDYWGSQAPLPIGE